MIPQILSQKNVNYKWESRIEMWHTIKMLKVCESITNLMYPFKWPHVYVPILPPSLENFLDAPVPYIMGLLRPTTDLELYKHGSVGILDIDHGKYL